MTTYQVEEFSPEEESVLRHYFTNLDKPVFGLVNLPEVVKGALFARYSRTSKSLRRLFIDEFVGELDVSGDKSVDATVGLERAEHLYEKVFFEYGDDSVAQLGGVHLACEQASNLLTKILEWGRLAAYLEQSTRYIEYDHRPNGRYLYYRDNNILNSKHGTRYIGDMDRMFDVYSSAFNTVLEHVRTTNPKAEGDSDFIYRMATKAKALDAVRGMLPASAQSNVGIYATGQSYEQMLLRMFADPLPEARDYAQMMLTELRKVIPSFLKRVDLEDRGKITSKYLSDNKTNMKSLTDEVFGAPDTYDKDVAIDLVDFDPDAEDKMIAAMAYPYSHHSEQVLEEKVKRLSHDEKVGIIKTYVGDRQNRRHRPGRAFERSFYRFDILSDYGAFRDMQRHRMLTIDWQQLNTRHSYTKPELVDEAGVGKEFDGVMAKSSALYEDMAEDLDAEASYAVCMAYRVRYSMNLNARAAMHTIELRSVPEGHPAYRLVAQEMFRKIRDEAGHKAIAEAMSFVNMSTEADLERLEAERRSEAKREAAAGNG